MSEHEDTAWFERLYASAEAGEASVPWFRGGPNPFLAQWVDEHAGVGAGRRALVIGTALGDDAEGRRNVRVLRSHANGQPAIGTYSWDDERGAHLPTVLQVLTFDGDRITEITGFVDPSVFGRFGLPAQL